MKQIIFSFFFCLVCHNICGQSNIVIEEPDFIGQVVYVKSDTEGIILQKENAQLKTKAGASLYLVGIGSIKSRIHLKGTAAETRIKQSPQTRFIVRAVDNKTDPLEIVNIIKFDIYGKERRSEIAKVNSFGGESSNNMTRIGFNAKKYGEDSYLISIDGILRGEYGVFVTNPNEKDEKNSLLIATFGVDNTDFQNESSPKIIQQETTEEGIQTVQKQSPEKKSLEESESVPIHYDNEAELSTNLSEFLQPIVQYNNTSEKVSNSNKAIIIDNNDNKIECVIVGIDEEGVLYRPISRKGVIGKVDRKIKKSLVKEIQYK